MEAGYVMIDMGHEMLDTGYEMLNKYLIANTYASCEHGVMK